MVAALIEFRHHTKCSVSSCKGIRANWRSRVNAKSRRMPQTAVETSAIVDRENYKIA